MLKTFQYDIFFKRIILNKKKKLDGFYFSVISWYLRSHTLLFIALIYVHHTHLYSTRLRFQNPLYATKTKFLHVLHVRSYALVVLPANYYVDTLH